MSPQLEKKSISVPVRKKPKIFVGSGNKTQLLEVDVNKKEPQLSPEYNKADEPISAQPISLKINLAQ